MDVLGTILPSDSLAVAIVGTRKPSTIARQLAFNFAFVLAQNGVAIISGLARGIDTAAHRGAIAAGGRTIAVLGSGIDVIYPPENQSLSRKISEAGAVVSEFPKGTPPFAKNFLARNHLIVDLAQAVLVIEGAARSGTLSTASWAARSNKEVFVVPGSPATDYLLAEGASLAKSPLTILEYLHATNYC